MLPDGRVRISTPPHPETGHTQRALDVLEWIHALTSHIPDPRQHNVLYFGAYACRRHIAPRRRPASHSADNAEQDQPAPAAKTRTASWARLIKRVFEVDPLLCSCGGAMYVVSFITEPTTIDHILEHLRRTQPKLCEPDLAPAARAPPP